MLDFISIDAWQMFAQWANLCILCLLLKKFLFKPVQAILAKREAEINETYAKAESAEKAATAMQEDYEQRLSGAKEEAAGIVQTATQRATQRSEEMLNEARNEAAALKAKADEDIASERKKAAGELKNDISGMAIAIAGKVVGKEIDEKAHEKLINDFISHVGDAS